MFVLAASVAAVTLGATSFASGSMHTLDSRFVVADGFYGDSVAKVPGARELATLPNGDLLVGTRGDAVDIVPHADVPGAPGTPHVFAKLAEGPASGVAYGPSGAIYVATNTTIWKIPYTRGQQSATDAAAIARVRTGPVTPNSDGDVHRTTSVVATSSTLYASVGSSCNACAEVDPTRATVQEMHLDGSGMHTLATRTRNAMALAIDPASEMLWIGGAGQDGLAYGHPYEYLDPPTSHGEATVDYGWPQCEENHHAYDALHTTPAPDCSKTVEPAIAFPAYATLVSATFYPVRAEGRYAFPHAYRGGVFVASHGSWHCCPATTPRVYFVAMKGDKPATAADWSDPLAQSTPFLSGLGSTSSSSSFIARPTGVAVGAEGSLFVADDENGAIYRIRPDGT